LIPGRGKEGIFLFTTTSRLALRSPPRLLSNGYQGLSLGVKCPQHEVDHSPKTNAQIQNVWTDVFMA